MKCVDRATFYNLPAGTVFSMGEPYAFGPLLIKDGNVEIDGTPRGFYAINPCFPESDDISEAIAVIDDGLRTGRAFAANRSSTRYMDYDGDPMTTFLIFGKEDIAAILAAMP